MKYFLPLLLLFTLLACKSNTSKNAASNNQEVKKVVQLQNKIEQLQLDNQQKDSVINEALSFFNDIQSNLAKISLKEGEIRIKSSNPEISKENKNWILKEIQHINFLRKQNANKISQLQGKVASRDHKIEALNTMINKLVMRIKQKNKEIEILKKSLANLNMEYAALFDDYQEQVELAYNVMAEMNTVYYAYGTQKELIKNNVIVKEGGFIGLGRETNMADNLNEDYFQKLDKTKVKELTIVGEKPEIITSHPSSSYQWEGNKLIITHPNQFWKVSKYLVIVVK